MFTKILVLFLEHQKIQILKIRYTIQIISDRYFNRQTNILYDLSYFILNFNIESYKFILLSI